MKHSMEGLITIVPAIRRLDLVNVGVWESLSMEFAPRLNVISGHGLGRSTILRSILAALGSWPEQREDLTATAWKQGGSITLELASPLCTVEVPELAGHDHPDDRQMAMGPKSVAYLGAMLAKAERGRAALLERHVLNCMDLESLLRATPLIEAARCQVICISTDPNLWLALPFAKVFTVRGDGGGVESEMEILQPGGEEA